MESPQASIHGYTFFLMTFLIMLSVIFQSMLTILLSILSAINHLICGNNYLVPQLDYDLGHTVDLGRMWLVDFNAGKSQLVSFDRSNNIGAIDVKMGGFCS